MSSRKGLVLLHAVRRYCSQHVNEVPSSKFSALKETQKKFQVDDGAPVYLKAGFKDKALYQSTLLITGIAVVMATQVLYELSFPKKN